jgi:hypothetical protein
VTLTQGEIEARKLPAPRALAPAQAARLKGRLRSWDSLAVPLWGGVPQSRCVQLGYYCLQLPAMLGEPELQIFASRESGEGRCSQRAPPQSTARCRRDSRRPAERQTTCWPTWWPCSNTFRPEVDRYSAPAA